MAVYDAETEFAVRVLINDTDEAVFSSLEIEVFLDLEGGSVKLAAAQALDTIADDEALTSKVIRSQDLSTDGASVARGLRERARALRSQTGGTLTPQGSFPAAPDVPPWAW